MVGLPRGDDIELPLKSGTVFARQRKKKNTYYIERGTWVRT
jgi:hypothetical protein